MKLLKRAVCLFGTLLMSATLLNPMVAMAVQPPVEVEQITTEDLSDLLYGSRVVVRDGTKYYASADEFGSGPYGIIGGVYTELGTDVYVGGFALLDESGRLVEYRGYSPGDVPVEEAWQTETEEIFWGQVWVELFLDSDGVSMLGWSPASSIVVMNGVLGDDKSNARFANGLKIVPKQDRAKVDASAKLAEQTTTPTSTPEPDLSQYKVTNVNDLTTEAIDNVLPDPGNMLEDRVIRGQDERSEDDFNDGSNDAFISTREIAYAIEDYAENGEKVALLLDASDSVSEYMSDIADYGDYAEKVNLADVIAAFARKMKLIKAEEYLTVDVDSKGTNIYDALNSLGDVSGYDRIILVTDTWHNTFFTYLNSQPEFYGKFIMVCPGALDEIRRPTVKAIEKAYDTTIYLCRLDNELDRIRTMEILECR